MWQIPWLAEEPLAFQEGIRPLDLVSSDLTLLV